MSDKVVELFCALKDALRPAPPVVPKALSLSRPWPWAFLHAPSPKRIENRCHAQFKNYRGPLLLHAAQSWDPHAIDWMQGRGLLDWERRGLHGLPMGTLQSKAFHQHSVIFARCQVVGSIEPWECGVCGGSAAWATGARVECDACTGTFDDEFVASVNLRWWVGSHALVLADVEPTPLVVCKGAQGLWTPPAAVLEQLGVTA